MRRLILLLSLTVPALGACAADADGDGFNVDEDCNDNDADINPDATEVCDGQDNNCNDEVDEGVTSTFYNDQDRDGYGDEDMPIEACEAGPGQADNADDCNDDDDEAFPGADEVCLDEIDNDCDGEVDEDDAVDATTWYQDTDGDDFGVTENSRLACDPGEGWAADDGDCDDGNADVNPGADEVCGDGVDNDCKDGADDAGAIDAPRWHEDADEDAFGNPDVSQRACEQPDGWVSDDTDCDDTDRFEKPGVEWYTDGDEDGYGLKGSEPNACERLDPTDADTGGDCDDGDPEINPGADEIWYDDVDQDCDGGSDFDQDGDTYESAAEADGEDCDDMDPAINPMAGEIDDGIDNDCDSLCDEGYIFAGDLIITEVMQNPSQSDDEYGEYVEVYNDSGSDITICGGWSLEDADSDMDEITGGPYTIGSGDYFVFGADSDTSRNGNYTPDYDYDHSSFVLANGNDEVIIVFDGTTIDEIEYDDGDTFPDPTGQSMNLDPDSRDATDNDDGDNWCETNFSSYGSGDLGTPGDANEECPEPF